MYIVYNGDGDPFLKVRYIYIYIYIKHPGYMAKYPTNTANNHTRPENMMALA